MCFQLQGGILYALDEQGVLRGGQGRTTITTPPMNCVPLPSITPELIGITRLPGACLRVPGSEAATNDVCSGFTKHGSEQFYTSFDLCAGILFRKALSF